MLQSKRLSIQQRQNAFSASYKKFLQDSEKQTGNLFSSTLHLLKSYEHITHDLYRLRAELPFQDPLRQRSEDFVAHFSHELATLKQEHKKSSRAPFMPQYRQVWKENFSLFLFTLFIFIACILLGWHITLKEPGNASIFLGEEMIESIFTKHHWFASIQDSPLKTGLLIAWNNIQVAINCFLFGALLGIGGIYILAFNGMMLGSVLAFCKIYQFEEALINFIVGHGALELTLIVASAFASFLIGRVFYQRPYSQFKTRMTEALKQSKIVLMGILPWFILAAAIEVFISPQAEIPFEIKVTLSIAFTLAFWLWTLWPSSQEEKA